MKSQALAFSTVGSALSQAMAELRNKHFQTNRSLFRANLKRVGTFLAYEISTKLNYTQTSVETPLGFANVPVLYETPVLGFVMRAALPMYEGFLEVFPNSDTAFVGAMRGTHDPNTNRFGIDLGYIASPSLEGKTLILIDPMLATGKSLIKVYESLVAANGRPAKLYIACAIAAQAGVDAVINAIPENLEVYCGAIDAHLNEHAYIVPGLGDAGDLAFGGKI